MEALGAPPNIGVIMGILPGTDGVLKMSKSLGNHIPLTATPEDMYGKVMSVPDAAMPAFFRLVTRWDPAQVGARLDEIRSGAVHPRDAKMALAREIVAIYHGEAAVEPAEEQFRRVFQEGKSPDALPEVDLPIPSSATDALVCLEWVDSRSEARRKVGEGAVWLDDMQIMSSDAPLNLEPNRYMVFRLGKKRQARIRGRLQGSPEA
jgi:tyrosyl-tRNA synthetase